MLEQMYKLFGDKLPEKHVFFATEGAPTRAPLLKEFGSWLAFANDYQRYVAKKKSEAVVKAKAAVKAPTKAVSDAK